MTDTTAPSGADLGLFERWLTLWIALAIGAGLLLGELAPGLVVVDEAYAQFADWTALDLVSEDRPLVVTRTFSKTWSMAGACECR